MPLSINKDAAKDANTVYQFNLSGDGGGQFAVTIKHGECKVEEGTAPAPDVTVSAVLRLRRCAATLSMSGPVPLVLGVP